MDTRTLAIIALLGFPALAAVNAVYFGSELKRFVQATPRLASTRDLERFKVVVAHQMYAALAQIVLLVVPIVVFFAGMMFEFLEPSDLAFVIAPAVVIIIIAAGYRGWESRAKAIPTDDPELADAHQKIVHTWLRKPFPNW
jgi:hypothetical protein